MKKSLKTIKFCLVLFALPIVATAAAAAHQQIVDTDAITIEVPSITVVESTGIKRIHTVALNEDGAVEGRIRSLTADGQGLAGLQVRFLQNGTVVKETVSAADGTFIVSEIPAGVYSFVASGANGFAAYSVNVVLDTEGKYGNLIEATATSNVASVEKILEQVKSVQPSVASSSAATSPRDLSVNGSSRVALKDGSLHGHLMIAQGDNVSLEKTAVHLLQGDTVIAVVETDAEGKFIVKDIKPGVYDLVAVGPSGFAALSLEAVAGVDQQTSVKPESTVIFVSTNAQEVLAQDVADTTLTTVNAYLVSPQDFIVDDEEEILFPIEYAGESVVYGGVGGSFGPQTFYSAPGGGFGGGGGGFGGGGAGFGGGGGGRMLAIAALTVGVIAIADNDPGAGSNPNP